MPSMLGVEEANDNIVDVLERPTNHFNYASNAGNTGNAGNAGDAGDAGKSSKSGVGQVFIEGSIKIILIAKDTYLFEYKH